MDSKTFRYAYIPLADFAKSESSWIGDDENSNWNNVDFLDFPDELKASTFKLYENVYRKLGEGLLKTSDQLAKYDRWVLVHDGGSPPQIVFFSLSETTIAGIKICLTGTIDNKAMRLKASRYLAKELQAPSVYAEVDDRFYRILEKFHVPTVCYENALSILSTLGKNDLEQVDSIRYSRTVNASGSSGGERKEKILIGNPIVSD